MPRNRRLLLAVLSAALVAASAVYVVMRVADDSDTSVTASDRRSTTTPTTTPATSFELDGSSSSSSSSTAATASTTASSTTQPRTTSTALRPSSSSTTAAPTTAPSPPFASSIRSVTTEELGASWRPGCPVGADQLRALDVSHWGYDGAVRTGRLIVAAEEAERIVAVFRDLYAARFPVRQIVPIDRYGGDDQASMRDDNTSGFNCRTVAGSSSWSEHAYGRAIDVNPLVNPYVRGSTVDPPEGAPYADRSRNDPGMIHADDAAVRAFAAQGWRWGGYWSKGKDYQHFSASGR